MQVYVANAPISYGAFELTVGIDPNVPDGEHVLDEVRGAGYAGIDLGPEEELASIAIACPECEAHFRKVVLRDVRQSPLWYLSILGQRLLATVLQTKLWPYGPRDGISVAPGETESEGNMDKYYRMTTTVDFFGFGSSRHEIRVGLLLAPTLLLAALAFFRRDSGLRPALLLLLPAAIAALVSPVLITTASAVETEIFALTYFLGAALLLEWALGGRFKGGKAPRGLLGEDLAE